MGRIYVVEDDEDIREMVLYALRAGRYEAVGFGRAEEFYVAMADELPDLVILDIMLPGEDGLAILKKLRNTPRTQSLPVIMVTAKGSEFDKVKGLDMGADDYIAKPFSVMELISRVGAVLRRSGASTQPREQLLDYGGITLDNARRVVSVGGKKVSLAFREFELLHYLMLNRGLALERDRIMEAVWGYNSEVESRTLDMHIHSLRQKLEPVGKYIETIRSVGYKFGE